MSDFTFPDIEHLREIRSLFEQLETELDYISEEAKEEMLKRNSPHATLPYCIRCGSQSIAELLDGYTEANVIKALRKASHEILCGAPLTGVRMVTELREKVDPDIYEAAVRALKEGR